MQVTSEIQTVAKKSKINIIRVKKDGGGPKKIPYNLLMPTVGFLNLLTKSPKTSNKKNSLDLKSEITGLCKKMDRSKKSLTDKITQTGDNLKTMIKDNAIEFKEEIQRIDKWLDENNAKTNDLTEKALRENNA